MRELLVVLPLYLPLVTSVVVVVSGSWQIVFVLSMVKLLSLREPSASGLSPSVVVLKEHVVQARILLLVRVLLVKARWYVTHFIQIIRTHLRNVHVNQVAVVSINFEKLIAS